MGSVTGHNHMPTNPVVDPIGCSSRGSEIAHGALPTFRLPFRAK
jgi:hypothetical protein